ncbi:MAG: hypothetical protein IT385_16750 [Deltaproteobacteria bacterium]|nr:hypothetical protein [Deltaproteobacteria bacterium]
MSRARLAFLAVTLAGALATWLVTLELGPWRPLVALLDGDYVSGAELGAHHRVVITLPADTTPEAARALADELDERLRPTAGVLDVADRTIVLVTEDARAETRASVEGLLTQGQARFEIARMLDQGPVIDALRRFAAEQGGDDVRVPEGGLSATDTAAEADAEAPLRALLDRAARDCAACRPGPDEAVLLMRDTVDRMDGTPPTERWSAHVVSRAPPHLAARDVAGAELAYDDMNRLVVMIALTAEGEQRIEALTGAWLDRRVAMIFDGAIHSAPLIRGVITRGPIQLSLGAGRPDEQLVIARDLVARLRPGVALPAGATLAWSEIAGADAGAVAIARAMTVILGALVTLLVALGLARLLRLEPAPASLGASGASGATRVDGALVARALLTLGLALAPWAVARIPLPLVDHEVLEPGAFGLGALGLTPVLLAHLLVALVVALAPRLRHLRGGGLEARRRLAPTTALVALALCVLQAWPLTLWIGSFDPGVHGVVPGALMLALSAGTFALWGAAALITRFGVGHGLAVLLAAAAIEALVGLAPDLTPLVVAALVVSATAVLAAVSFRARVDAETTRRMPLAGLVPLDLVTTLFQIALLITTLAALPQPPWLGPAPLMITVALVGLGLAWLLARPLPARRLVACALVGAALLVLLLLAQDVAARGAPGLQLALFVLVAGLPVVLVDLGGEVIARLRLGPLARVTSTHDVDRADQIAAALAHAGVPVTLRAVRLRALLRFMGPWLPVEVLVPSSHEEAARRALAEHTHADVLRPFGDDAPPTSPQSQST